MTESGESDRALPAALRRSAITLFVVLAAMAVAMFVPAGIGWKLGWIFLGVFVLEAAVACWNLLGKNTEIFIARSKYQPGMKPWDKKLALVAIVALLLVFPVAGLDERWQCSRAPLLIVAFGYAILTLGMIGSTWVMGVNKFAEPGVRIQTERGHHVVDTGPYAFVRHPMYVTMFFVLPGYALALGSYWALTQDEEIGYKIVLRGCRAPLTQIADNAGADGGIVCEKVAEGKGNFGYNAATAVYEDLVKAGVVDPTKVTRTALQNAASVATLLLTSDAIVADKPKEEKGKNGAPGGEEDMY